VSNRESGFTRSLQHESQDKVRQLFRGTYVLARTLIFIGMLSGASMLHAQASPTASKTLDIQIGGGFTSLSPDTTTPNITGPDTPSARFNGAAAYFDVNFRAHYGVEGEFHYAPDSAGTGQYEKTYEAGGRYFRAYGRFIPYAKALYGRGVYNFTFPFQATPTSPVVYQPVANLAYNLVAGGIGVDYELLTHVNLRADFEYQRWFSFEGSGISPSLATVGAAYHF